MAEYRALGKDESPPVDLWVGVFGVEAPFFTSLLGEDDLSFAAFEDGEAVSSVHVFVREIRDREGRPLKVGGIGSVSTRKDHERRGHSGRLLEMALDGMARAGCVWSLLGTGVNDHYARYGWRTVSTPEPWGELREDVRGEATTLNPDDGTLTAMAALYDADTAVRPMATVRSEKTWRTAVRYRLENGLRLGDDEEGALAAYVVARNSWGDRWSVVEAAGDEARFPALFAALATELRERGIERIGAGLPEGPAMDAFAGTVDRVRPGESRAVMLRPIADRISWPDLLALYGDPRGRHGDLDAF